MRGGRKVVIEPHRHEGVFICRGKEDALVTKNMVKPFMEKRGSALNLSSSNDPPYCYISSPL